MMLILLLSPIFLIYVTLGLLSTLLRFGKVVKGCDCKVALVKDFIHCDYVFASEDVKDLFPTNSKFVKVGWGDRKIFLETRSWSDLKALDFLKAFFGMNPTVLRVDYLNEIPHPNKSIDLNTSQMNLLTNHIRKSFYGDPIKKETNYYNKGEYYNSKLQYSCITNCNNWINRGLYLSKATNKVWCPFSFML